MNEQYRYFIFLSTTYTSAYNNYEDTRYFKIKKLPHLSYTRHCTSLTITLTYWKHKSVVIRDYCCKDNYAINIKLRIGIIIFFPQLTDTTEQILLGKLTVTQLVRKFPAFYWTLRFITVFTRARHRPLSWARRIQSTHTSPPYFPKIHYNQTYTKTISSTTLPKVTTVDRSELQIVLELPFYTIYTNKIRRVFILKEQPW
jgi:hypothetical protein